MLHPIARKEDLIVKDMTSELVIYDQQNNQVHALNALASQVWRQCDGTRSIQEIAEAISMPFQTVELALQQLADRDLLADRLPSAPTAKTNRRRKLALAAGMAVAIPAIISILATPAWAKTSKP